MGDGGQKEIERSKVERCLNRLLLGYSKSQDVRTYHRPLGLDYAQ